MTVKELQKLKRQELLELLVEQSREAEQLKSQQEEKENELRSMRENNIRLKAKVDEKDVQIERLTGRLNSKKERIKELESEIEAWYSNKKEGLQHAGTVAEILQRDAA